ncbi:MAG TPA: TIGR04211 family SH3 domain-containing protein [Steroidobacteraceae bacterium]|nr:TIGR04211 family SH3 domain-containing protein [Steroidobacteraceae bacterium]
MALLAAPLPGIAQEEGQQAGQQSEPSPPVRKLFVSDKLVLNVYSEADQGGSRVATIETGDAVDELERADNSVRIRLGDGREGWVGANYLTGDAPAAVQLRELQRQQKNATQSVDKKAADEIARLKKESDSLQAQVKELKTAAAAATPAPADDGVLEGAQSAPQPLSASTPPPTAGSVWIWLLAVALTAGLSYAAGFQTLARRIRKKFGGLRIY